MNSLDPSAVSDLAALVQRIVGESGDPGAFDAHAWTNVWLASPCPALGGACPADYMDTKDGRGLVKTLILRMQSGAYS